MQSDSIKFDIIDKNTGRKMRKTRSWYISGDGVLWYDRDPEGVDMSGKREIIAAPDYFIVKKIENKG